MRETKGQTGIKPIDMKKYSSRRGGWWEEKAQKDSTERSIKIQMQEGERDKYRQADR